MQELANRGARHFRSGSRRAAIFRGLPTPQGLSQIRPSASGIAPVDISAKESHRGSTHGVRLNGRDAMKLYSVLCTSCRAEMYCESVTRMYSRKWTRYRALYSVLCTFCEVAGHGAGNYFVFGRPGYARTWSARHTTSGCPGWAILPLPGHRQALGRCSVTYDAPGG